MAVGRISGPLLKSNLLRQGIDLAFETDLLYLDVNNQRIGVKTSSPTSDFEVNGTARTNTLLADDLTVDDVEIDDSTIRTSVGDLTLEGATEFDKVSIPRVSIPDVQGNVTVTGDFETTGNIHAQGNITADGNITLGNEDTDNVSFNADINSDITPDQTDTYNFGTDTKRWNSGYFRVGNIGDVTISSNTISPANPDQDLVLQASGTGNVVIAGLSINQSGNVNLSGDRLFVGNALVDGDADRTGLIAQDSNTDLFLESSGTGSVFANGVDLLNTEGNSYFVSVNGNDTGNNGESWNDAYLTLGKALQEAEAGDTVYVGAGTFEETAPLEVPKGVQIQGHGLRTTQLKPTAATRTEDFFLLDGEVTINNLTVREIEWDSVNQTGYAFRYKNGAEVTLRSAYLKDITVLNFGSSVRQGTNASDDPYGFDASDAGRGALVDGSVLTSNSLEAAMLFDSITMIVPNSFGLELTEGARAEWLNSFVYFADTGILAESGTVGLFGEGQTIVEVAGVSGTIQPGDSATFSSTDASTQIVVSIEEVENNSVLYINGRQDDFEGFDFTPESITFSPSGATAESITRYDRSQFGAELRSIASANVYGNFGVSADGPGIRLRLSSHDFGYIGSGKKFDNNDEDVITANEVNESNGGRIFYTSSDQFGDYRIGDSFFVNQETGEVTFEVGGFDITSLSGINFTDGSNQTIVDPLKVETGNLRLSGNELAALTGDLDLTSINGTVNLNDDTNVIGNLSISDSVDITNDLTVGNSVSISGTVDIDSQTTISSLKVEDLTENRITLAGTNGELEDTAELTYDGTTFTVDGDGYFTGNLDVDGNISLGGNIRIGDQDIDTVEVIADFTSDLIPDQDRTFDLGQFSKRWDTVYANRAEIDDIAIENNFIRSTVSNADIDLIPNGTGTVVINTDQALRVPVGDTSVRPIGVNGELRYNTTKNVFEGFSESQWVSLQDLQDADEDSRITLETAPGEDEDTVFFTLAGTEEATLSADSFDLKGSEALFANEYATFASLPDAFTYTGMFAYVTATNKAYYARFGEWIELVGAREDFDIDGNLTANDVKIGNGEVGNVLDGGDLDITTVGTGVVRINGTEASKKGDNVSDFVNDAEYIDLTDLAAVGDITYDNTNGVFSVTTYKTADFDEDFSNSSFDNLADTALSTKSSDELIRWSGTNWVNFSLTLDYISDVNADPANSNDLLVYNGTNWSIGTTVNIDTITNNLDVEGNITAVGDVTTTSLNTDDVSIVGNRIETTRNDLDLELQADGTGQVTVVDNAQIQGSLTVTNNVAINGNTTLGASSLDTVDFVADISSNIVPETATQTLGSTTTAWQNLYVGNLDISGSTILARDNDANITITPNGVGYVDVDTSTALLIPTGTTLERPTNVQGMIRYNTDDERFEAYNGTAWTGLGGVIDVDQDTFIIAETSPGSDNDQLELFAGGSQIATFDLNGLAFNSPNTNTISTTSGDLILDPAPAGSQGAVIIQGDLNVEGTTTTINSTITTLDDPVITLGGDANLTTNDGKDRGVEFRYYSNGARLGFFGYDENQAVFKFIPDATNQTEVFSGAVGDVEFRDAELRDITANSVSLSTDLAVEDGGTGTGTFTVNGILYGNGTDPLSVTDAAGTSNVSTSNELLTVDGTGTPVWTDTIDEGTY